MTQKKEYCLIFLFEPKDGDTQRLEKEIERVLFKHLRDKSVELATKPVSASRLRVEIKGGMDAADACHEKLDKEVYGSTNFVRLIDEVSDELRKQAYLLVSELEQKLRLFIQEAMIEVLGFSWWEKLGTESVRSRVSTVGAKSQGGGLHHLHPIEFSEFEHLVTIITGDLAFWRGNWPLTVSDLQDLLSQSANISELRKELARRTQKKSFWDTVFSRFFENTEEWQKAEQSLTKIVIPLRHQVMHHRPMRLYEFRQLKKAGQTVLDALEAKQRKLKPQEKTELKSQAETLSQSLQQTIKEALRPQKEAQEFLKNALEALRLPSQELQKHIEEALHPFRKMEDGINDALALFRKKK